jgi:hypothetical protein
MRRFVFIFALFSITLASGCGTVKVIQEKEREKQAIRAAIDNYISEQSHLNLADWEMELGRFNTDRDRADVQMIFHSKRASTTMLVNYSLQREAGIWVVKRAQQEGGSLGPGAAQPDVKKP